MKLYVYAPMSVALSDLIGSMSVAIIEQNWPVEIACITDQIHILLKEARETTGPAIYLIDTQVIDEHILIEQGFIWAKQVRSIDHRGYIILLCKGLMRIDLVFKFGIEAVDYWDLTSNEGLMGQMRQCLSVIIDRQTRWEALMVSGGSL